MLWVSRMEKNIEPKSLEDKYLVWYTLLEVEQAEVVSWSWPYVGYVGLLLGFNIFQLADLLGSFLDSKIRKLKPKKEKTKMEQEPNTLENEKNIIHVWKQCCPLRFIKFLFSLTSTVSHTSNKILTINPWYFPCPWNAHRAVIVAEFTKKIDAMKINCSLRDISF